MPDQLPSAILDSANAFDTLFAINLDTKQRFDNILSGAQKPIDYPIPDYDKEMNPQGLPQDELMNPSKMAGSIGEGLFSSDPRIASYATDKFRTSQSRYPVNQGIGVPDRFEYAKEMNKYLRGDYGYNPYMSLEDNEDFNYRYDYLNQNVFKRIFSNVGTGVTRFLGSVGLKLGQGLGHLGAMIFNGVEEIFDGKDNNFMADVADNSLSRWFEGLEQDMKDSNLLSVYKPRGWDDKGFFNKLGNGAFWTDEVADGAAFMGEMVASMYLLGGLGRIGAVGKLGATEINLAKSFSKLGAVGRNTGKVLDSTLKLATGAKNLSGVGRWAFATTSESAFEAAGLYTERKDRLRADREAGLNEYTDLEIERIAGDSAAAAFKANMLILSASNAFENRFIFGPLFKKIGIPSDPTPGKSNLIDVSTSVDSLDDIAKASRKTYNYKTYLGKKLDWKNSNSRGRFYGSRGLSAVAAEGFWEENAQLAAERLASAGNLTLTSFMSKIKDQTIGTIRGDDPEAATSIGLGAIIGGGATGVVTKLRGGDRLFQGERRKIEADTLATVEVYENFRKGFLNYQDIYVRDPQTGKPVMDSDGNLQIDETKAAGLLDGTNQFISKQQAADKVTDPLFRKHLQDLAMKDYVVAAKMAGIYDRAEKVFETLRDTSPEQLMNLGLDPNSTVDSVYLRDSLRQFGIIYDSIQKAPPPRFRQGDTEADDRKRREYLYQASTGAYSATKIIGEFQSKMLDRDFPSVFSPDAEGNTSEVQQYNSLVYQEEALNQFADAASENGDFYDGYIRAERARIRTEKERLRASINIMIGEEGGPIVLPQESTLLQNKRGLYYTPSKYEGFTEDEIAVSMAMENDDQKKHAEYTNVRNQNQYLVGKFSNPDTGIQNLKAYLAFVESIHRKDAKADEEQDTNPPTAAPTAPPPPSPGPQTPPPTPSPVSNETAIESADVITGIKSLISTGLEATEKGIPDNSATVVEFINDNPSHVDIIRDELLIALKAGGDTLLQELENGTYVPGSDDEYRFNIATAFIFNVVVSDIPESISTPILDYIELVSNARRDYNPQLTEAEQAAIDIISGVSGIQDSAIKAYVAPLLDPDSSIQEKKDALRGISDQYSDSNTMEIVSAALGLAGSEAIEALGYPEPTLQGNIEAAQSERSIEDLAARAGLTPTPVATSIPFPLTLDQKGGNYQTEEEVERMNSILPQKFTMITPTGAQVEMTLVGASSISGNWRVTYRLPDGSDTHIPLDHDLQVAGKNESQVLLEVAKGFAASLVRPDLANSIFNSMVTAKADAAVVAEEVQPELPVEAEDLLEMTKIRQTTVFYDRNKKKFVYRTPTGKETRYTQAKKVASTITPRFFRTWYREMSDPVQRQNIETINSEFLGALREAQIGQATDTLELVLIRNLRNMRFTPPIMDNLTDVPRAAWSTEDGEPLDTFVSDFLLGEGNVLEQNGFSGYEEQELMNMILDIIAQYPDGIRIKDITAKERENNPATKLEDLEKDFFDLVGLDLIKSLEIYNNERESLNSGQTEVPETPEVSVTTHADIVTADTEGSGITLPPQPPKPPVPPQPAENSDEAGVASNNFLDISVDTAKMNSMMLFPENMPEEVVMEGDKAKIVDGAIQLKTTQGDQQRQARRAHNIKKKMGDRNNPTNFWSEDADGNPIYKIKLEFGDEAKHTPWVYNTGKGLINQKTRKPNRYPFIVAMVTDSQGNYVYFDDEGNVTDIAKGMPYGFVYTVEDYLSGNLKFSRRGLQLRTGELLNGAHGFLNDNPLGDLTKALQRGVPIFASILDVTSGKLSTYNVDNSGATYAKEPQMRTVKEMEDAGDISDTATFVLSVGEFTKNPSSVVRSETAAQEVKLGQAYLHDEKTGLKIPLRGKKIKDLTLDGKSIMTEELRLALEELSTRGFTQVTSEAPTAEQAKLLEDLFQLIRAMVYSRDTPVFLDKDKTMITMLDQRPVNIPLLETEINYSTNISSLRDPFDADSEGFSYKEFVKENFMSGAVPAEVTKGEKSFEKLNRRIIFMLDKDHQGILDSIGATANTSNVERVKTADFSSFVNKTYKRRGRETTITVTGFADGNFTLSGPTGVTTQSADQFMKELRSLEEVKLPAPTEEVRDDFQNNIKVSQDKHKELNEKARTMSKKDLDDSNYDC